MKIKDLEKTQKHVVAGHRGAKALYPENTMLSFTKAIECGVDMIELDLRLSKDHVLMVMHDENIENTLTGRGPIGNFTCAELKDMDAGRKFNEQFTGTKIATFEEVCERMQEYPEVLLNVEVKYAHNDLAAAEMAVKMTEKYGMTDRCVYNSFDATVLALFHDKYDLCTHGFPAEFMYNFVSGKQGTYSKMWSIGLEMKILTPQRAQDFRDAGILTWSFCPDNAELMEKSLACGITLSTCNNPAFAINYLKEKGIR